MLTTLFLLLNIGCWAPEVKPPEPKLSPRELETKENGEQFQQANSDQPSTENNPASKQEILSKKAEPPKQEETPPQKTQEIRYPFSTTLKQETALLGHGGGQIMLIPIGSNIDILEKQDSRYHIICKNCSPNRPRQAGFISLDAL